MGFLRFVLGIVAFIIAVKLLAILLAVIGFALKIVWLAVVVGIIVLVAWGIYKLLTPDRASEQV
ncbi:MAG TPA: hypothetical protein VKM94_06375 [Blastocatellia bacterium]|nr:hypothetical protein [Blastocatellia bacterium]